MVALPPARLEVVGQLCAPRVTLGVHRHKHARAGGQAHLAPLEQHARRAAAQRGLQRVQLLRDDRQHLARGGRQVAGGLRSATAQCYGCLQQLKQ